MNTVSGSSTFSTSSASNRGMSGLVSGLDTEGMVESMLSGTQGKIDKANQEKQVINWKQEVYRDLISEINGFKSTFFGSTSSTNFGSADFFNSMTATSTSGAFGVTASPNATTGRTSVQVGQLATASKLVSQETVSGTLSGKIDLSQLKREVVFKVGSDEKTVSLENLDTKSDGTKRTEQEQKDELIDRLKNQAGIEAEFNDKGQLVLKGDVTVSSKSSSLGLSMLGLTAGKKSTENTLTTTTKLDASITFDMDLNGITKTITLDNVNSTTSDVDLKKAIQEKIDDAFGKGWVTVDTNSGDGFILKTKGKGNIATIGGSSTGLKLLGVEDGESNKIARGQQLGKMGFETALQGSEFKFTINDVDFSFNSETTLNDVMKKINGSKAGVRITYSEIEDKFTIESSSTGSGHRIDMKQEAGNLLNALFGDVETITTGGSIYSNSLVTNQLTQDSDLIAATADVDSFNYGYFKFTVDGTGYSIAIPQRTKEQGGAYSKEEVLSLVNEGLASRFGYVKNADGTYGDQNIELVKTDGKYSLEVRNGSKVSFKNETVYDKDDPTKIDKKATAELSKTSIQLAFGFGEQNNTVKDNTVNLSSVGMAPIAGGEKLTYKVNRKTYELTLSSPINTIQDLENAINNGSFVNTADNTDTVQPISVTLVDGKLKVTGVEEAELSFPPQLAALFNLGGSNSIKLNEQAGSNAAKVAQGQNALVTINGVDLERSSNTFTVNGLTFSLNDTTGNYLDTVGAGLNNLSGNFKDTDGKTYTRQLNYTTVGGATGTAAGIDNDGYLVDINGERMVDGTTELKASNMQSISKTYTNGSNVFTVDADGKLIQSDGITPLKDSQGNEITESTLLNVGGKYQDANGTIHTADSVDEDGFLLDADGNRLYEGSTSETVNVTRDTEKIFEGLKSFVEKYNELTTKMNKLVDQEATYKDYPPLTSEQKKEMSDREVELWEEKAKEGLFRNDSDMESFLSSMRLILYTKPTGSDYALYDIGIESSSDWKEKGKLELDESKLKTMIESNPQGIMELFTNAEEGLSKLISDAVDRTAGTNSSNPGSLVALAGVEGKATAITNTLTKRIRELNERIKELTKKYESERDRYWKQFNSMETALSNLNTQSSWLAQQFA